MRRPKWWTVFMDVDNAFSSKRVIGFVAMEALGGCIYAGVYQGLHVDPAVYTVLGSVVCAGIAGAASERFGSNRTTRENA